MPPYRFDRGPDWQFIRGEDWQRNAARLMNPGIAIVEHVLSTGAKPWDIPTVSGSYPSLGTPANGKWANNFGDYGTILPFPGGGNQLSWRFSGGYGRWPDMSNPDAPYASSTSNIWNPRCQRVPVPVGFSDPWLEAVNWKIKVFGPAWGIVCQYGPQNWNLFAGGPYMPYGPPLDSEMAALTPDSYVLVDVALGASFEFTPTITPDLTNGYMSIAIFWPGKGLDDFAWG